jgi:hypothetical protein
LLLAGRECRRNGRSDCDSFFRHNACTELLLFRFSAEDDAGSEGVGQSEEPPCGAAGTGSIHPIGVLIRCPKPASWVELGAHMGRFLGSVRRTAGSIRTTPIFIGYSISTSCEQDSRSDRCGRQPIATRSRTLSPCPRGRSSPWPAPQTSCIAVGLYCSQPRTCHRRTWPALSRAYVAGSPCHISLRFSYDAVLAWLTLSVDQCLKSGVPFPPFLYPISSLQLRNPTRFNSFPRTLFCSRR